jgi:hypothetical protein
MRQYDYSSLHYPVSMRKLWSELPSNKRAIITIVFIIGFLTVATVLKIYVMILAMTIVLTIAIIILVRRLITSAVLRRFAEVNDLTYVGASQAADLPGLMFQIGRDQCFKDGVADTHQNWMIANYSYIIGSGKNSRTQQCGIMHFKLTRHMPHVLIQSVGYRMYQNIATELSPSQGMQFEGDFNKYFTTYAPQGYQRDALYFLTPELMVILIDQGKDYTFELVDDNLFIYGKTIDFSKKGLQITMEKLLTVAQNFSDEFNDNTHRYTDGRVHGSSQMNAVALEGQRLKKGVTWTSALLTIITILFVAFIWTL